MDTINNNGNESQQKGKEQSLIFTVILVVLVIAAFAVSGFLFLKPGPDTVQGMGDATEIRISGKLPGRVVKLYVSEGDYVKKGDTLVHIHSSIADAQLAQAMAVESAQQATVQKVDAGTRPQIVASAKDLWNQAQAAAGITQKTYERMEMLFDKGVISEQKRDEAKAAAEAARAAESAARSQYELAVAGAQKEDKAAVEAMAKAAAGGVQQVDALLEDQYLLAPVDGNISVVYPNESELVALGAPIMSLQKSDYWVVFNMRENYLKDIDEGTKIRVKIPALDREETLTVFYIRDLGTYANWQATKATGDYDARTFEVKARPEAAIPNFRPGMSVIYLGVEGK